MMTLRETVEAAMGTTRIIPEAGRTTIAF